MKIVEIDNLYIDGIKWSGTYDEASTGIIRDLIFEFIKKEKCNEFYGVAVHDQEDGFSYYIGLLTTQETRFMIEGGFFLEYSIKEEEDVTKIYSSIHEYLKEHPKFYPRSVDGDYDVLPIKIEKFVVEEDFLYKHTQSLIPLEIRLN